MERKCILYIAMSLDGYIAKPNDDLGFLSIVEREGEDYGYGDFMSTVDTIIMGRRTYDWVIAEGSDPPFADTDTFIITKTPRPSSGRVIFFSGELSDLIRDLKAKPGKNIFCVGGAKIVTHLLKSKMIDEFVISVIPILVGYGIRLFENGRPEQRVDLVDVKRYDTGLVQLRYGQGING